MSYLSWSTKKIEDFAGDKITALYDAGYVFTRVDKGIMNQTRSLRINLNQFEMSSENRRILKNNDYIELEVCVLPYKDYSWEIGRLAKDFYEKRDADFSANKIKEILTDDAKSNFNTLLVFRDTRDGSIIGYAICYVNDSIIHYSYPFYRESEREPSRGLAMMIQTILWAKESGKKIAYLGSLQRPSDTYKLQFKGEDWFDGKEWQTNTEPLREILSKPN